jgi:hypothetical protein
MSQVKRAGLLTVLVFLTGCHGESELLHPGGPHAQKPAAARIEGGTRGQAIDAETAPPGSALMVRDAGAPATSRRPDADAGSSGSVATVLPTVHVALKNATGRTIWYSESCYSFGPASVGPTNTMPASEAESKASTEAVNELGCVCDCNKLGPDEVCRREICPGPVACHAGIAMKPIAPGETVEADYTPYKTQLDLDRKCSARVTYPARTEMIATFCYMVALGGESRCTRVPFRMGDQSVTYVATDMPDDAGI